MGFAQTVVGGYSQASLYDAQKRQARIAGEAKKKEAYAKADASERATKQNLRVVGENLARVAGNKRRDEGSARAASAASGFAPEGSALKREELVSKAYDDAMNDMARSGSTASMNALDAQIAMRRSGDAAMRAANVQADLYGEMAKISRTGAFLSGVSGVIGAIGGAAGAPAGASWQTVAGRAIQASNGAAGMVAAFNPFLSEFAPKDWDRDALAALGIGQSNKYKA